MQYEKYNMVLRGCSDHAHARFHSDFKVLCRGNKYATTLHVCAAPTCDITKGDSMSHQGGGSKYAKTLHVRGAPTPLVRHATPSGDTC